jgi:hypothetical protein
MSEGSLNTVAAVATHDDDGAAAAIKFASSTGKDDDDDDNGVSSYTQTVTKKKQKKQARSKSRWQVAAEIEDQQRAAIRKAASDRVAAAKAAAEARRKANGEEEAWLQKKADGEQKLANLAKSSRAAFEYVAKHLHCTTTRLSVTGCRCRVYLNRRMVEIQSKKDLASKAERHAAKVIRPVRSGNACAMQPVCRAGAATEPPPA